MDVGREALLPERARGEDRSRVELEELRPDHPITIPPAGAASGSVWVAPLTSCFPPRAAGKAAVNRV